MRTMLLLLLLLLGVGKERVQVMTTDCVIVCGDRGGYVVSGNWAGGVVPSWRIVGCGGTWAGDIVVTWTRCDTTAV